jgi:ABC-type transport system involved in cytochrome c biogenesis permease subunit
MFLVLYALPGGWSFPQLAASLAVRRGFYLFIAISCLFSAAGLSLVTKEALGQHGASWHGLALLLLAFAGVLYFTLPLRVNEEALGQVLVFHVAMGITLLLAVAAKALDLLRPRRALHLAWAVLLLITGLQLVSYRESDGSFAPKLVTMESSPELPALLPPK